MACGGGEEYEIETSPGCVAGMVGMRCRNGVCHRVSRFFPPRPEFGARDGGSNDPLVDGRVHGTRFRDSRGGHNRASDFSPGSGVCGTEAGPICTPRTNAAGFRPRRIHRRSWQAADCHNPGRGLRKDSSGQGGGPDRRVDGAGDRPPVGRSGAGRISDYNHAPRQRDAGGNPDARRLRAVACVTSVQALGGMR